METIVVSTVFCQSTTAQTKNVEICMYVCVCVSLLDSKRSMILREKRGKHSPNRRRRKISNQLQMESINTMKQITLFSETKQKKRRNKTKTQNRWNFTTKQQQNEARINVISKLAKDIFLGF